MTNNKEMDLGNLFLTHMNIEKLLIKGCNSQLLTHSGLVLQSCITDILSSQYASATPAAPARWAFLFQLLLRIISAVMI